MRSHLPHSPPLKSLCLKNRTFTTMNCTAESHLSSHILSLLCGLPQASILSSLLFSCILAPYRYIPPSTLMPFHIPAPFPPALTSCPSLTGEPPVAGWTSPPDIPQALSLHESKTELDILTSPASSVSIYGETIHSWAMFETRVTQLIHFTHTHVNTSPHKCASNSSFLLHPHCQVQTASLLHQHPG